MTKQRITIFTIALLGFLATFMPWSSLPILGSMNGINTSLGKISILLFVIPLITALIGNKLNELKGWQLYLAIIPSILAATLDIIQIIILKTMASQSRDAFDTLVAENISIGFGLYIAILAGLLLPVFTFLMKDSKKSISNTATTANTTNTCIEENDISDTIEIATVPQKTENKIDKEDHSRFMPK